MSFTPTYDSGASGRSWKDSALRSLNYGWHIVELNILDNQAASCRGLRRGIVCCLHAHGAIDECRIEQSDGADCLRKCASAGHVQPNSTVGNSNTFVGPSPVPDLRNTDDSVGGGHCALVRTSTNINQNRVVNSDGPRRVSSHISQGNTGKLTIARRELLIPPVKACSNS